MFWVGVITAGMTAFYVFRAFFIAFIGEYRGHHHPHESPPSMTGPLIVLAVLSTVGGFFDVTNWLAPMYRHPEAENLTLVIISVAAGVIGIAIAAYMYWLKPAVAASMKRRPLLRLDLPQILRGRNLRRIDCAADRAPIEIRPMERRG